ncbi:Abi family protein [Promicromonospora sukumoe]|uniref:Abi-like protein n=1 Tax=Promicromonospora sukumoe TaxID=88382 RepID=A0A7W3J850_9MICO|nr:hypothetical protein [Promicromonospora sukumoe]MBA8808045.1 hypothetical protein [Promicromonospora sukumoe]
MAVPTLTATHHRAVATLLSAPRLAPYLRASGGNVRAALMLYQWNVEMSSAVYKMLHLVEVFLRNAMDAELRLWNATQIDPRTGRAHAAEWLLDPSRLIERVVRRDEIDKATRRAALAVRDCSTGPRAVTHDDILAQMMFGTWRFLLPSKDPGRRFLWRSAISMAFPHLDRPVADLVRDVDGLYRLRNRIAHLEPLLPGGAVVKRHLRATRRVLEAVDPSAAQWLVSHQTVSNIIAEMPVPTPEMPNGPSSEN